MLDGGRLMPVSETPQSAPAPPADAASAGAGEPAGRLVFDLTTTALWSGPPVGIVRVESELGRWGLRHLDRLVPAFFDPQTGAFRRLSHALASDLISQRAAIDTLFFVSPARKGKRKTDRIPAPLRPLAMWLLQSRRMALQALERIRLGRANSRTASLIDTLQRAIMNDKYRAVMVKADGSRRAHMPIDMALESPVDLTSRDTLICTGAGWTHDDIKAIAEQKRKVGFRFALLCFDIIPLMFPHFYKPADVAAHRDYCHTAFPIADLVVFNSRTVEADVRAYCRTHGLALGATAVSSLGADFHAAPVAEPLPAGLERDCYALLVSTIEPRKGHRMIYEAWLKLLESGLPQRSRFKLVFAGRVGWLIQDLMRDLRGDPRLAGTLELLTDADDARIATLYRNAAFCLYPSRYEGYGLPVIEAFSHGKAVLASTGGAVPEVVGDFSPCLDPDDAQAWQRMLARWIEEPSLRAVYVERIRTSFRRPTWDESAQAFFTLVSRSVGAATGD
jgi:glycosyltransferase involved in cell wall biosynthesis